jgi:uncharacterized GH25 family protein
MKKIIFSLSVLSLFILCSSHEFWIEPKTFFTEIGQPILVSLQVGENFTGEKWAVGTSRVTDFSSFLREKKTNWLAMLEKKGLDSLECRFSEEGTHLLSLKTNSKFIELEAEKFNEYLHEDGLDAVSKARILRGDTLKKGKEFYRREAASLIQVGKKTTPLQFDNTNFDLKIIPEKNPLTVMAGSNLTFQITFKNKPFANALVCHWHKINGKVNTIKVRSDANGKVEFKPQIGDNMISVVQMIEHTDKAEADWQSIWGNLTFGIK